MILVIYSIKAQYVDEKMDEFYQKLTDGTISNQKPDGQEIVASMKRAKITDSKTIGGIVFKIKKTNLDDDRYKITSKWYGFQKNDLSDIDRDELLKVIEELYKKLNSKEKHYVGSFENSLFS